MKIDNRKAGLVQTFARATEMGSLMPTEAKSVYPSFLITQAWDSSVARFLWMSGLLLTLGLIAWVGILIPSLPQIPFGFNPFGVPDEIVPSTQLILLPLVSSLMFVAGMTAGLYFYRWDRQRPLAFVVWGSSTFCAVLFLLAVLLTPRHGAHLNADSLRFYPCRYGCLSGISSPQSR